jgi:exodeoxyribonuclease III
MKLATWNVNSLKVRLPHVLEWLGSEPVDILCLQETKLTDDKFPLDAIRAAGYEVVFAGQPTYNGVAILAKQTITPLAAENPLYPDPQRRIMLASIAGITVLDGYFPNGQSLDSDKYQYKLAWLDALLVWVKQLLEQGQPFVLTGDFNIAPADADVHNPAAWEGQVLVSAAERQRFAALLDLGLTDCFRAFEQAPKLYSWWDYRNLSFRKNTGLRIDHILVNAPLASRLKRCWIDKAPRKKEQPSDHTPVVVEFDWPPA